MTGAAACVTGLACIGLLFHLGVVQFNNPSRDRYPVRGIDVSEYQGRIGLGAACLPGYRMPSSGNGGSSYIDPRFAYNWSKPQGLGSGRRVSLFSFDSPGRNQAENSCPPYPRRRACYRLL